MPLMFAQLKIDADGVIEFPRVRTLHYQHKGNIINCRIEHYSDGSMTFARDVSPLPPAKCANARDRKALDRIAARIHRAQSAL